MAGDWLVKDTSAQMGLDFLLGISVFLVAFIFVFAFIPGLFVPFVSNSDELTMTADRASIILTCDILAKSDSDGIHPSILDARKIAAFDASMSDPVQNRQIRSSMGLNMSGNELYNLEIVFEIQDNPTPYIINSGESAANLIGNIGQSKRFVMIRNPDAPIGQADNYPGRMAIMTVRVW